MQLNASTCYAMQMMLYLTRNRRTVSAPELADTLHISPRYISQISSKLRDNDLISTHAGMSGGYCLNIEPNEISAYDIIKMMEGDMSIHECIEPKPDCGEPCMKSNLFDTLSIMKDYLETYLKTITFDKLANLDINGRLSEIFDMVHTHIDEIKHQD
jgi:Rrf2 family protein